MAYQRTKGEIATGEGLDTFIDNLSKVFSKQIASRNAVDEASFQNLIIAGTLDLEDQLDYRKKQLERVEDPEERKRVRTEIASLKKRVDNLKFNDTYTDKLVELESGITSIDTVIDWLNNQRANTTDDALRSSIDSQLIAKESEKFSLMKSLIKNQTEYAINDKTESVIDEQISNVTKERNKALLANNKELASNFNLQLQSLNQAKAGSSIEKDLKNFAVSTIAGYSSATQLLDVYNQKISSAGITGAVKVGDITYASPREFWTYKRDSYISDSSGSGFFSRVNTEINNDIKVKNSKNTLTMNDISTANSTYNNLLSRPELQAYSTQLNTYRQDSLQTGADFLSNNTVNKYTGDLDVTSAFSTLNSLKAMGVNVDSAYTKILSSAAQTKEGQVTSILNRVGDMMDPNSPNFVPNLTVEQAVNKAIGEGQGAIVTPNQLVTKPESQIATELGTAGQTGTFKPQPATTTNAPSTPGIPETKNVPPIVPQATIEKPPAQTPVPPAPGATPTPKISISKQLDLGATDPEVKALQQFLNKQGFLVSTTGAGSLGQETDYFGPLTQAALKKFQAAQGIVSKGDPATTGYGRVGPQTLAKIKQLYGAI